MDNTYNTNIDELFLKNKNLLAGSVTEAKNTANAISDSQTKVVNDSYNKAVADTNKSYTSEYQKNAVQKLINEQNVAEKMANLGLAGSGLNRTQQTAVQMGYSNNKAAIDRNKQSALDTLAQNLSASIAQIEQQRAASLLDINNSFDQQAMTNAMNEYNTNMNANLVNSQMEENYNKILQESNTAVNQANEKLAFYQESEYLDSIILSEEDFNTYKKVTPKPMLSGEKMVSNGRLNTNLVDIEYVIEGNKYNNYEEYVESVLRENYKNGKISEATLRNYLNEFY